MENSQIIEILKSDGIKLINEMNLLFNVSKFNDLSHLRDVLDQIQLKSKSTYNDYIQKYRQTGTDRSCESEVLACLKLNIEREDIEKAIKVDFDVNILINKIKEINKKLVEFGEVALDFKTFRKCESNIELHQIKEFNLNFATVKGIGNA